MEDADNYFDIYTMSTKELANLLKEAKNDRQKRFCFILGAGASIESGIDSGAVMSKKWMDCIMGKASDGNTLPMDPERMEKRAEALLKNKKISHLLSS